MTEIKQQSLISNFAVKPVTSIKQVNLVVQAFKLEDDKLFLVTYSESNHQTKVYEIGYLNKQIPKEINLVSSDLMLELNQNGGHTQSFAHFWRPNLFDWSEYHMIGCGPEVNAESKMKWTLGIGEWNPYRSAYNDSMHNVYYLTYFEHVIPNNEKVIRSEFAVSADGTHFLLALNTYDEIKKHHNLHLFVYNTDAIINELSDCQHFYVPIDYSAKPENHYVYPIDYKDDKGFSFNDLTIETKFSFQGFAIDNKKNVYISSEFGPLEHQTSLKKHDCQIIKISNNGTAVQCIKLNGDTSFESKLPKTYVSEFEEIQADGENDVHLMVAYHDFDQKYKTVLNKLFAIKW